MEKIVFWEKEVSRPDETAGLTLDLMPHMSPGSTFLLYGDLGSGKTFLVKQIIQQLESVTEASSPSFAIIHQHSGKYTLYHIDLYRIHEQRELVNLGLDEILASDGICFIEWPQIIEAQVVWPHYRIYFESKTGNEFWRKITFLKYE